ncbi:MAG: alpha/beta fold hydrolase [Fulvivirga sp.]|nr:alpha/beta fold hydrolase [Fulvivirga sp.]
MQMDKQQLIILHGALGASHQFKRLKFLLQDSFEVHLMNFSGHGGKPFESDFSIQQFAHELDVFINENGLNEAKIFGYSMGGYVALHLARKKPGKISKIFTLGTKFDWTPESAEKEVKMLNPDKIEEKIPAFAQVLAKRHAPNNWREVLDKTKQLMIALGEGAALSTADFQQTATQAMIGIGTEDEMVSMEESQYVANALPHGLIKVFEGVKHPIEKMNEELLVKEIKKFFKK